MSSEFYVLKYRGQTLVNREMRVSDEVTHVREGGYVFCSGRILASWAKVRGFEVLIDPTGEFSEDDGVTIKEARKMLKLPAGAVDSIIRSGKLEVFTQVETGAQALSRREVEALVTARKKSAKGGD